MDPGCNPRGNPNRIWPTSGLTTWPTGYSEVVTRLLWEQEIAGSNPAVPTRQSKSGKTVSYPQALTVRAKRAVP